MKPRYQILANDTDITGLIREHFASLSVKDSSGLDSDSLILVLSDPEGVISWPRKGVRLKLWLGFDELDYKGTFVVDELDYMSPPNQLHIVARATDIKRMSHRRRSRHWGDLALGHVIDVIAAEQGLIPAVSSDLANRVIPDVWQMDETDLHFLSRIADTHQAIAQVKNGRLLLTRRGSALTVSGQTMPVFNLHRNEAGRYHYSERQSEEYDAVRAKYRLRYSYRYNHWYWRYRSYYRTRSYQVGRGQRIYTLPSYYANRTEAMAAANAMYQSLAAGASELSITLDQGQPQFIAEAGFKLSGFIPRINELDWVANEVTHKLDSSGLSSSLRLVRPMSFKADS